MGVVARRSLGGGVESQCEAAAESQCEAAAESQCEAGVESQCETILCSRSVDLFVNCLYQAYVSNSLTRAELCL